MPLVKKELVVGEYEGGATVDSAVRAYNAIVTQELQAKAKYEKRIAKLQGLIELANLRIEKSDQVLNDRLKKLYVSKGINVPPQTVERVPAPNAASPFDVLLRWQEEEPKK
jgi:hypothetical protein